MILVDTGAGNGKKRPGLTALDQLNTPYLAHLAAGIRQADVDDLFERMSPSAKDQKPSKP